jgi:hypothetical protein
MSKMRNKLITAVVFMLMAGSLSAQDLVLPELPGFKKITSYPVFGPENLWDFINGAADNYLSYGFVNLHVAEYKKGRNIIKLEIYKHANNTMAFGIYSSERSSSFRFINLGSQGYKIDGAINFFKGNYYVKIRTYSKNERIEQSAESLAIKVSEMLPGESKMPSALLQFPEAGKKQNEETFINESVLGHSFLKNAFKALYQVGNDSFSIFIIESASSDEARKMADAYLKSAGIEGSGNGIDKVMLTDGYNGPVFLAVRDKTIVLVSGLSKDQSDIADRYTSEILK